MPHYEATIRQGDQKTKVTKSAPSVSDAESLILQEMPDATILEINRVAGAGEYYTMVARNYK